MTFKAYKEMIEDQNALDAAAAAAFSREKATESGGGDPDMAVTFVAATPFATPSVVADSFTDEGHPWF